MEIYSGLIDRKIMGVNVSAEMTFREYLAFAGDVIKNNDLQRTPVRSEGKPYELLRRDLMTGCVIPPVILAVSGGGNSELHDIVRKIIVSDNVSAHIDKLREQIEYAIAERRILILDGLQRTLTIMSVFSELSAPERAAEKEAFLNRRMRFEIYLGLSKQGILYRMLTLNTGQTPMSFRHQLEILYHDYLDGKNLPEGIQVFKEVDERRARGASKYKFSDVVELFYSYSTGSPLPYDKQALVSNLKEMSFLESYEYDSRGDSMNELLACYNKLSLHVGALAHAWTFDPERLPDVSRPFGNNVTAIFSRTQPMAAFGAECKSLMDKRVYADLAQISATIETLRFTDDPCKAMDQLIVILNQIGAKAKKIGDAQRYYFQLAFRELLLPQAAQFQNLSDAWAGAQEKYEMLYT